MSDLCDKMVSAFNNVLLSTDIVGAVTLTSTSSSHEFSFSDNTSSSPSTKYFWRGGAADKVKIYVIPVNIE